MVSALIIAGANDARDARARELCPQCRSAKASGAEERVMKGRRWLGPKTPIQPCEVGRGWGLTVNRQEGRDAGEADEQDKTKLDMIRSHGCPMGNDTSLRTQEPARQASPRGMVRIGKIGTCRP